MADASHATNPSLVNSCEFCGSPVPPTKAGKPRLLCGMSCYNKKRADHTTETLMHRFWKKVDKTPGYGPNGDCWEWQGRHDGRGYGEIKIAGKYKKAHRISLFGRDGLDNPLFACHRCDNPKCVNPSHLFAGEAIDNVRDMITKGRSVHRADGGSRVSRKLSAHDVRFIRSSDIPRVLLAQKYGVDAMVIHRVRKRITYRDVA